MTVFDICVTIVAAFFIPACVFFAINDTLDEKPCIFINKFIHKNNPNLYIYKLLSKYNTDYSFEKFSETFTGKHYFCSELLTSPLKEKEKNIILNAYRFVLGLINTNTFNKNKETAIISYIFRELTISKDKITNENIFEKENFIIGNYKLINAVFDGTKKYGYYIFDGTKKYSCYIYNFLNTTTKETISVVIDLNKYDKNADFDKDEIIKKELNFLFN